MPSLTELLSLTETPEFKTVLETLMLRFQRTSCNIKENMSGLKIAVLVVVAIVASTSADPGPRCVDQQDNCAHFVENKPEWCNALLAQICPKSCGHCEGECVDKGDWCADRQGEGWCESAAGYMNRYCKKACELCV